MKKSVLRINTALLLLLALTACGGGGQKASDGTYVKPVESSADRTTAPATTPVTEAPTTVEPETTAPITAPATEAPAESSEGDTAQAPAETSTIQVIASGVAPGATTQASGEAPGTGSFEAEDLVFSYKGRSIRPGDSFNHEDYEEVWGSPDIEKGQACIGGGYDENYYYGDSMSVLTLGDSGGQIIYDIFIAEEGYATPKGAVIGQTTREELWAIYGEPSASLGATDRYRLEDTLVSFTFSGGILTEIDYNNTD